MLHSCLYFFKQCFFFDFSPAVVEMCTVANIYIYGSNIVFYSFLVVFTEM